MNQDILKKLALAATMIGLAYWHSAQPAQAADATQTARPNILWISVEDMSPDLGCYGDSFAATPTIDRLAAQGARYTHVFAHAGVCAPARSGIITGMYPTTIGTHHMRCQGVPPPYVKCFTEYLRAAGYYCSNNSKTDYQFAPPFTAWDESSNKAHWRNRAKGQPFFAVFNLTITHESQVRNWSKQLQDKIASLKPHEKHDPAKAALPPYYPDTPVVRRDWAQYYDIMTLMDKQVARILDELEADGLADDTIVWFWADHGRGLPRAKRWIYDSGLRVPLIIRAPDKFRRLALPANPEAFSPGAVNDDLIAFIDFGPTVLSLAGVPVPDYVQGRPFLGAQKAAPRQYVFAARDRMDEAYDLIRAVRDKRYKYIRNYMPHLTYSQDIDYMNQMPTMQEMRRLNAQGKLSGPQQNYFLPAKPIEELYDTLNDPHEVNNLAADPDHKDVLQRLRKAHLQWVVETGDIGLIPEPEFDEMKRPGGQWAKTAVPVFAVEADAGANQPRRVEITCATKGSSIAYKIDDKNKRNWTLYSGPITVDAGQALLAKACRIGFRDSAVARFKIGEAIQASERTRQIELALQHWSEALEKTDLLNRLRAIKQLDFEGARAMPKFFEALNDEFGAVRYWAVIGLHNLSTNSPAIEKSKTALAKLLDDPSPVVRIAAAHALCDWGADKTALPVLANALKHDSDSVRLYAAIALGRIGEKARPVLPEIDASLNDPFGYVGRVAKYTLERLEQKPD